jgi:dihydroxynaphthoic acid synthetase
VKLELQDVIYQAQDGVARVTINRPEKLNAFRMQTILDLITAFEKAEADDTIGVAVLSGAGGKAFCVGGDVETLSNLDRKSGRELHRNLMRVSTLMRNMGKPVIAAVNGYCMGGGNELNVFCDLTIATEKSRFAQVGPRVGSVPMWGGTQMLPRLVGEKRAREIIFLCREYTAQEAYEMGWVNKVVPEDQFEAEVDQWCQRILDMSPQSIRLAKASLNFESDLLYASLIHGGELLGFIWGSDETLEGTRAFLEKRKSNFRQFRR